MTDKQKEFYNYLINKINLHEIEYEDVKRRINRILVDHVNGLTDIEIERELD
jgi:hypothetical protein